MKDIPPRAVDLFWRNVHIPACGGCWLWSGGHQPKGYPVLSARHEGRQWTRGTHRFAYELLVGPIPEGLELDHLCRNRSCCNPAHLEPVTHLENMRRAVPAVGTRNFQGAKTHCPKGHEYDASNTYTYRGRRYCKTCQTARNRARAA